MQNAAPMSDPAESRRLATILSIDIAGFSRASELDEMAAARNVRDLRRLAADAAGTQRGRIFNTAGDGLMLEFPTVSDGVAAALDIADRARETAGMPPIRMGLHVGDVTVLANGDLIGTGVNIAARVQQRAMPGAILVTGDVRNLFAAQAAAQFTRHGAAQLDKMARQVDLFRLSRPADGKAVTVPARRHWWFAEIAAAVVALAIGAGAYVWFVQSPAPHPAPTAAAPAAEEQPVVAVLPFENLSGDASFQYFVDGITEEIQYALSRVRGVKVISRPVDYAPEDAPAGGANGRHVRATHVLSGSVRRNGDEVRVAARLALSGTGEIVWTQNFDRTATETLAIQDEVASRVARALRIVVPETSGHASLDPRAFELYLRGRDQWRTGGEGDQTPQAAIADLEEAVRIAPGFARAWAALASAYAQKQNWVIGPEQDAFITRAVAAARKALELDPSMGEPYIVLGRFNPGRDWAERGALFDKALAAEPNDADVQMLYSTFWLTQIGQMDSARRVLRDAFETDPLSGLIAQDYAASLAATGNLQILERLLADDVAGDPMYGGFWQWVFVMKLQRGDFAGARAARDRLIAFLDGMKDKVKPDKHAKAIALLDGILAAMETQDPAALQALAERFQADARNGQAAAVVAVQNLAVIGRTDLAFDVAEELFIRDGFRVPQTNGEPEVPYEYAFDRPPSAYLLGQTVKNLQRDTRIWRIFAFNGLAEFWLETGRWPDFCAAPDLGYDCKAEAQKALDGQRVN
jgi:TolB-like protein/class 3 adenylate cyclase/tetratricopeptide (TPR) repeat protein